MKQKTVLISLILIGFVFVLSGSAWAGRGHHPNDHRGHRYHKTEKHQGHHFKQFNGWRHDKRFHRGWRHHRPYRQPIEKHVYHHYTNDDDDYADDEQYHVAGTHSSPGFSFSFGISGSR